MAQPAEQKFSTIQLTLMLIGTGIGMTVISVVLIQLVPIRLFVAGMILGPVLVLLGIAFPVIAWLEPKPKLPILFGKPHTEMIAFHCRQCHQEYVCARRLDRTKFTCEKCQFKQDIELQRAVNSDPWLADDHPSHKV